MSNYSILQQNTLDGLSEAAGILYLRLCDQLKNERAAFFEACRFDDSVGSVFERVLDNYHDVCELERPQNWRDVRSSLSRFISERWRNNFMKGEL